MRQPDRAKPAAQALKDARTADKSRRPDIGKHPQRPGEAKKGRRPGESKN
jgi:hypothetical protein